MTSCFLLLVRSVECVVIKMVFCNKEKKEASWTEEGTNMPKEKSNCNPKLLSIVSGDKCVKNV